MQRRRERLDRAEALCVGSFESVDRHFKIAERLLHVLVPVDGVRGHDKHIPFADAMRVAALDRYAAEPVRRGSFGRAADNQGRRPAHHVDDSNITLMAAPLGLARRLH